MRACELSAGECGGHDPKLQVGGPPPWEGPSHPSLVQEGEAGRRCWRDCQSFCEYGRGGVGRFSQHHPLQGLLPVPVLAHEAEHSFTVEGGFSVSSVRSVLPSGS